MKIFFDLFQVRIEPKLAEDVGFSYVKKVIQCDEEKTKIFQKENLQKLETNLFIKIKVLSKQFDEFVIKNFCLKGLKSFLSELEKKFMQARLKYLSTNSEIN